MMSGRETLHERVQKLVLRNAELASISQTMVQVWRELLKHTSTGSIVTYLEDWQALIGAEDIKTFDQENNPFESFFPEVISIIHLIETRHEEKSTVEARDFDTIMNIIGLYLIKAKSRDHHNPSN
jgi:hypothetical protein